MFSPTSIAGEWNENTSSLDLLENSLTKSLHKLIICNLQLSKSKKT